MERKRENKILREIRRKALARSDVLRREHECARATANTLDALEEVTNLPRHELETIAAEVRYALEPYEKDFFSIKNQMVLVFGSFGIVIVFLGLLSAWIA